jgi:hypothetical protein
MSQIGIKRDNSPRDRTFSVAPIGTEFFKTHPIRWSMLSVRCSMFNLVVAQGHAKSQRLRGESSCEKSRLGFFTNVPPDRWGLS